MTTLPYVAARVRSAEEPDLDGVTRIYGYHVENGTGSFEEKAPDCAEMRARFEIVRAAGLPFLVADMNGRVVGYAYAGFYRPRSAYRFTVEDSVYVAPDCLGYGIGRALLGRVVAGCTRLGYRQMLALIGDSANESSIGLHADLGFEHIGMQRAVGFKFGRWLDVVIMQRSLGAGASDLPRENPLRPLRSGYGPVTPP
jgi:phosphinothricin acetyltransferase